MKVLDEWHRCISSGVDEDLIAVESRNVTFDIIYHTLNGQQVGVLGSLSQLGAWNPHHCILLQPTHPDRWSLTLTLPDNTFFEWKFIIVSQDRTVIRWEEHSNRVDNSTTFHSPQFWRGM
eukprot:TRINITY_DN9590_c0_g2_i1.p1 TRINITY_DN9590_c0_g2~~TRINITY_DN9590_c0_g2_i1.p1  ORF type:complete len:120 (-),score=8.63 TRINITY_DN9590_c0_g2_i1:63-422(-)